MRKSSNGNINRKSGGQGLPPVRYNSKKGTIDKVNNSLGDTTSLTVTSETLEDNSSILSIVTVEEHSPTFGGKRNRFNSSPTLHTPVRNDKYSRRSNEIEPIVMERITERGWSQGTRNKCK